MDIPEAAPAPAGYGDDEPLAALDAEAARRLPWLEVASIEVPDQLRADVRLLTTLLGETLREYGGVPLYNAVEDLRDLAVRAHSSDPDVAAAADVSSEELIAGWPVELATDVARAFTVFFHLVNVAEEYHRVRMMRQPDQRPNSAAEHPESASSWGTARNGSRIAATIHRVERMHSRTRAAALLAGTRVHPVLTAHPTEARRRAVVTGIRRIADLLAARDDVRLGEAERDDIDRQLREQIDLLWRTAPIRATKPNVLDEVRTAMAVFDSVLFRVVPLVYRAAETDLAGGDVGLHEPRVPAFLRFGSWIGGDRDGNPNVTAEITRKTLEIQSTHVLMGLERAADRIGRALTADVDTTPASPQLTELIADAAVAAPDVVRDILVRSGTEPHRTAMLVIVERIRATRARTSDLAYQRPGQLLDDLRTVQESLRKAGAVRQAYGELQSLIWQVETFGFHLAELEVRQHSAVHRAALNELRDQRLTHAQAARSLGALRAANAGVIAAGRAQVPQLSARTLEVLDTIRVMASGQSRLGADTCRRYIISFTQSAEDIAAVYALAEYAVGSGVGGGLGNGFELDVVPLFETGEDLDNCTTILDEALEIPALRRRLEQTGRRMEVMLGYSDSAKDIGPISATLALYSAQERLAAWAAAKGIELTLFHGRGGALGRGGGPVSRAVLAQAPGSVSGRFKVTEQGEVIFARYGDTHIARRHLEQVTAAVMLASTPGVEDRVSAAMDQFQPLATKLDGAARAAYRALVDAPGFAEWFATVTPMNELGALPLGSRPARRGLSLDSLSDLRAIPWVFSWAQTRANIPGWYGIGSALEAVDDVELVRSAYAGWPLFQVMLDNVEMSLAKSDPTIMRRYFAIGGRPELTDRIIDEHARSVRAVLQVTGRPSLLANRTVLSRAVSLRAPYVDALSRIQVHALAQARAIEATHASAGSAETAVPESDQLALDATRHLIHMTVNGLAAGLQNTG